MVLIECCVDLFSIFISLSPLYTQKYFWNLIKSNQNQILFTIYRLICNQTDVHLVTNQVKHGKCNLISVCFSKISKIFLCVYLLVVTLFSPPRQFRGVWDHVEMQLVREGAVDPTGPCRTVRPINDQRRILLRDCEPILSL